MKSSLHIILFGSLLIFLTACSSTRVITLEMKIPPKITMPLKVENVIVLNNAAVQSPENINWSYVRKQIKEDVKIDVDTIPWVAAYALSDALLESDLFSQIDTYSKPIREDNDFLAQVKIKKEILSDFFTNLDYDAIISIDRTVCVWEQQAKSPEESKKTLNRGLTFNRIQGLLSCGIYTKDQITPLTTFNVRDSFQFYSYNDGDSVLVRETLLYLTEKMAETAASKLISTWERSDRTLFTSSSARMKEAYACVNSEDWLQAKTLWMDLFEQSNKPKNKARLSSNIAVAYEILGNFQEALEWAQKSKSYFEEMGKNVDPDEFEWIGTYVPILEKRIMDNKLLDEQQAIR
jgi:hypothetical protein